MTCPVIDLSPTLVFFLKFWKGLCIIVYSLTFPLFPPFLRSNLHIVNSIPLRPLLLKFKTIFFFNWKRKMFLLLFFLIYLLLLTLLIIPFFYPAFQATSELLALLYPFCHPISLLEPNLSLLIRKLQLHLWLAAAFLKVLS